MYMGKAMFKKLIAENFRQMGEAIADRLTEEDCDGLETGYLRALHEELITMGEKIQAYYRYAEDFAPTLKWEEKK